MGARPSSFKSGGGGFLHDVDAKIVNQEFTTTSPGGTEDSDHVFWRLTFQEDGSDEEKSTSLFVGKAEEFRIEDKGKTLVHLDADEEPDDSWTFNKGDDVGLFLASLVGAGFDENELPETENNFEAIEGYRVHLMQERNEERMKYRAAEFKKGNKRDKGGNEYNEKGQRKNKGADKFYDIRYLSVSDVYGKEKGKSGRPADKSSSKPNGKSSGPSTQDVADEVLLTILGKQPKIAGKQSLDKSKLPNAIAAQMGTKNPQLQEVRKLIYEDEFLERENGWSYDKSSKKQTITLS